MGLGWFVLSKKPTLLSVKACSQHTQVCVVHVWFMFGSGGLSGLSSSLSKQSLPDGFGIPSFGLTAEAAALFFHESFIFLSSCQVQRTVIFVLEFLRPSSQGCSSSAWERCNMGLLSMENEGFLNGWYGGIFQPLPISAFLTMRSRCCLCLLPLSPFWW